MKSSFFIYIVVITATLVLSFTACEKNKLDPSFKGEPRLMVAGLEAEGARADSISFSFSVWPTSLQDTLVTVLVQSMGNVAVKDRSFDIEVAPVSTALPDEYVLPSSFVLPANSFQTYFPVTIKRSPRIATAVAELELVVKENEFFKPGPEFKSTVNLAPHFRILWTDMLTQPVVWNSSMLYAVGKWSRVKHQAIIDVTGIRNFEGLGYSQTYAIASVMLDWLNDYNASHPGNPLKDENGLEVRICSQCN